MTNQQLARWARVEFNLAHTPHESTVARVLKNQDKYLQISQNDRTIKRTRVVSSTALEEALATWVLQKYHQRRTISYEIIQEKGRQFVEQLNISTTMQFSKGWAQSFCNRHGFRRVRQHSESDAVDIETSEVQQTIAQIKAKIAQYDLDDIYNMDESGSFYNMPPDTTIARTQIENDKTRMTIVFTCNATGTDRFEPLFIGQAAKPRCFEGKTGEEHGFWYFNNKKAWMLGTIFQKYLQRFDRHVERSVLLLIDNAPSHMYEDLELRNVEIVCMPPNTASELQPLNAGITASFKKHYRKKQILWGLDQLDMGQNPYKVDQLRAMQWMKGAWNNIDPSVFKNCWKNAGLFDVSHNHSASKSAFESVPECTPEFIPVSTCASTLGISQQSDDDEELIEAFNKFIQQANIQQPMSLENFLNPPDEDSNTQGQLTDDEILELVQRVDEAEDQEAGESNTPSPYLNLSKKEKITTLARTIAFIEDSPDGWEKSQQAMIQYLRRMQRNLRREMIGEQKKMTQTSIVNFFDKKV